MIFCVISGALLIAIIFMVISFNMKLSLKADLNIGLCVAIWAINPFFAALADLIIYRIGLKLNHIIGMLFLVVCGVLISLSSMVMSEPEQVESVTPSYSTIPAIYPILFSIVMPIVCTFQVMTQKFS